MPYFLASHDSSPFRQAAVSVNPPQLAMSDVMSADAQKLTSFPTLELDKHKCGVTCVEDVSSRHSAREQSGMEVDGVECASRPPSPPQSGTATPRLRLEPCPARLWPTVPPPNYGVVKDGAIFRSAFPQDRNDDFLRGLEVKTILCLVDTEPGKSYKSWVEEYDIKCRRVGIAPNKDGKIKTTWDSLCEALLILMDAANYPLYIHCNQGRHRTGCVVACLRRIQRWPLEDIIAEYNAYSSPKQRTGDVDLIRSFDPEAVFEYAQTHGYLDDRPFMRRMDSNIVNIDGLAEALSLNDCTADDLTTDMGMMSTTASSFGDEDPIEMRATSMASLDGQEGEIPGHGPAVVAAPNLTNGLDDNSMTSGDDQSTVPVAAWDGDTATTVLELSEDD